MAYNIFPDGRFGEAVEAIYYKVQRAKETFKEDFHNQHEGYAVILEELDELWQEVKKNQKNYALAAQKKEAIQCAAMCIRFIAELETLLAVMWQNCLKPTGIGIMNEVGAVGDSAELNN